MNENAPRRVEWRAPENWTVWADEDGVHIKSAHGDCLEQCEVERLFTLWQDARAAMSSDRIPAPKPPTREQIREDGYLRADEYAKVRAIRAVEREFTPETAPF